MKTRLNISAPDRLTAPAHSPHDAAVRAALQPFDTAVARVESQWGSLARLQRHATPETVAKFARAMHAFEEKLEQANRQEITGDELARFTGAVVRGLAVLEREAGDPKPSRFLAYNEPGSSGTHLIIAEREDDASLLAREFPGATIFSIPEIARVLKAYDKTVLETLLAAKKLFPEATLADIRPARSRLAEDLDDDIPF